MKAYHKKRLLKLADHLSSRKLGHTTFDYGTWGTFEQSTDPKVTKRSKEQFKVSCSTSGCALGECPTLFPRLWEYGKLNDNALEKIKQYGTLDISPNLKKGSNGAPTEDAAEFFGVGMQVATLLFHPDEEYWNEEGEQVLVAPDGGVNKRTVAKHIRKVVKLIERGDINPDD